MPGVIPEKVNKEQQAAITHGRGPLLIVAGAGTGKTTVITERLAHLIMNEHVPSDSILALTFTDKAAGEMQDRVERILPFGYLDLWVMTFHSFGQRLLQAHALDIGLSNDFKLLSQTDQWLLIREHLDAFALDYYRPLGNPTKFISALVKHFSRLKDEDISPSEYLKYAKSAAKGKKGLTADRAEADRVLELAKAYERYNQLLLDSNALDFGDLILYCLRLLRGRPAILQKYQQQFQYVLVDEFQDTNWAQYELIKLIGAARNNLTVVGDDDQSIYKFRGASVSNILGFKKDFPESRVVVLTKNYRTKQSILDVAHAFIQKNNPDRLEAKQQLVDGTAVVKKLKAQREGKGEIGDIRVDTQEAEARGAAEKIEGLRLRNKGLGWDSFCVLVRANDHAQMFVNEFERRGWPYVFLAARGLFTKPLVLDVLAYLRLLDNYHENAALYRVLAMPIWGIDHGDVVELSYRAKKKTRSLFEQLQHDDVACSDASRHGIARLKQLVAKHTELANTKPVGEVLLHFLNDSGYLQSITKEESVQSQQQVALLRQVFKLIEIFQHGERPATVKTFLRYIDHVTESGDSGGLEHDLGTSSPDTIKIMTIHSAKGLEFPYVFIGNVVEQRFPGLDRKDPIPVPDALVREILPQGDAHVQEERRLMYVAITRARDGVFFTLAEDYGGQRRKKPSPFLYELGLLTPPAEVGTGPGAARKRPPPDRQFRPTPPEKKELAAYAKREKSFSFTKLATYNECPWKYRYAFVLQVPKKGSHVLSYGSSIHQTLYNFFMLWKERQKNKGDSKELVTLPELWTIYDRSFIDEWYPTKAERKKYYQQGKDALSMWYEKTTKAMPNVLRLEQTFNLKVDQFVISGKIDRVDDYETTNSDNESTNVADESAHKREVRIVDYKTGKMKEKFEKDDKYQLLIYALAAQDPSILNAEVKELAYYFIDANEAKTMKPSARDSATTLDWIRGTVKKIQSGDFRATPSPMVCRFCDYREICEFRAV
ncbi:MAG: ATP-dependent helicase [Candidatus Kerfeldbacteria bacterium]|nr:ATP-dependent helicase [Candidatus Kerfeldbacteria bacterium]